MDILRPEYVWVENRCYRKIPIRGAEKSSTYEEEELYQTQAYEYRDDDDFEECDNLNITHENEKFWITIAVPEPLIGRVIGKQHNMRKSIEAATNTRIKVPYLQKDSAGDKSLDVVITGQKRSAVAAAHRRIEGIVVSGRWKFCDYTHFLSIPMNNDSMRKGFQHFKEDVLRNCKSMRGVSECVFEHASTLHLTLCMLTLLNDREREVAKGELNTCRLNILKLLGGKPLRVEMRGVEYMNDDPSEVDVLYGKVREVDGDNSLQILADQLTEALVGVNLARREYDSVKLHVTLMKSRGQEEEGGRLSFDARQILKRYSDYVFGEVTIKEIHISTRMTGNSERYYTCIANLPLS